MAMAWKSTVPAIAAAVIALAGSAARADISEIVFHIQATSALGTADYFGTLHDGYGYRDPDGTYSWGIINPVQMFSQSGALIATCRTASLVVHEDPDVSLNFSVLAGSVMTNVTVTSALVSFPAIAFAEGRDSATMEVSDLDGTGVSASPFSGGMYSAQYNGLAPAGTTFHDLLTSAVGTAVPGGSASASDAFPGLGLFTPIIGTVNNISSRFNFVLTANDLASQTSTFRVQAVPAPGALVLMGLGGLAAARRRRH